MSPCLYFDAATPGVGPMGMVNAPAQSVELAKYNGSYNLSLRSKSDLNLNPQPEGNVYFGFPKSGQTREGIYAIETDRGELSATAYTQVNTTGQKTFQNRLQDPVRPTTKETTLFNHDGGMGLNIPAQSLYSNFIPTYTNIEGSKVRTGGASNFGLKSATDFSYFPGVSVTGVNNNIILNPDAQIKQLWKRPDFNVDGPGTYKGSRPDATRFQNYNIIAKPVSNALKFTYNLETNGSDLHDYSPLLGKKTKGIENRYTSSYQIEPLFSNPLNIIWNPDNKGEIPSFYCNTGPQDFSYMNMAKLPGDKFIKSDFNDAWQNDNSKSSSNAYVLGIDKGIHNNRIEWNQEPNSRPGIILSPEKAAPAICYSGNRSVNDLFMDNQNDISRAYPYTDKMYTTLGDPLAGFIKVR